jgi:hypothetical protein
MIEEISVSDFYLKLVLLWLKLNIQLLLFYMSLLAYICN